VWFVAANIRRSSLEHVLYASDELPGIATPRHASPETRRSLPPTDEEFSALADSVTPCMR
jgi:hypothetical protein